MSSYISLSGLSAAQLDLNTTSNNIANANTYGFKESRAEFADVYSNSIFTHAKTTPGQGVQASKVAQQFHEGSSIYNRNLNYLNIEFVELGNIDLIKFDTFWEEEINKEIIDLFKLDIEGNELSALKGSIQALESTKVVQFEFGGTSIDARNFFKDYFFFFKELNFELFRMRPNSLIKITQYAEEEENFTHSNFLAVNNKYS